MKKREEILLAMSEAMPYSTPMHLLPYIREAMDIYATEAIKADRERVAENAKTMEAVKFTIIDGKLSRYTEKSVNKESILNLPIELP